MVYCVIERSQRRKRHLKSRRGVVCNAGREVGGGGGLTQAEIGGGCDSDAVGKEEELRLVVD